MQRPRRTLMRATTLGKTAVISMIGGRPPCRNGAAHPVHTARTLGPQNMQSAPQTPDIRAGPVAELRKYFDSAANAIGDEAPRRSRHWPGWQSRANGPTRVDGDAFCQRVDASSPAGHVSVSPPRTRPGEHCPHWRCIRHATRQPHPCRRQAHAGASTGTVVNLYNTKL